MAVEFFIPIIEKQRSATKHRSAGAKQRRSLSMFLPKAVNVEAAQYLNPVILTKALPFQKLKAFGRNMLTASAVFRPRGAVSGGKERKPF